MILGIKAASATAEASIAREQAETLFGSAQKDNFNAMRVGPR
jgi:hypothetical protein